MNKKSLFYQESGNVNLVGTILTYLAVLIFTIFVGYIYNALILGVPLIYLNFFIAVGFGLGLAILLKVAFRFGKNRRKSSQLIFAVVAGLLANYFQWTAYVSYALEGGVTSFSTYFSNLGWIVLPQNFFPTISKINSVGMWSMFGMTFNGVLLTIVWVVEFFIILGIPVYLVWQFKTVPFSEKLNRWYERYTLEDDFESFFYPEPLLKQFDVNPLDTIANFKYGNALRHSKVYIYYLEKEETQYLDFERVSVENQGKGKVHKSVIIDNYKLEDAVGKEILSKFRNKKLTLLDHFMY